MQMGSDASVFASASATAPANESLSISEGIYVSYFVA